MVRASRSSSVIGGSESPVLGVRRSASYGSRADKIATREIVGGRRAHQMCKRFCGGRCRASLSAWHSAESDAHGRPASRNDGLVFTNAWLTGAPPVPSCGGECYPLS